MKDIIAIQNELKAPKTQFNSFGRYNYRSAEDILEAVKPLLAKYEALLNISDEVIEIGERIYVKATATITSKAGATRTTNGWAREDEVKKGMDGAQITGSTSSYARKYALNGLFLIDDTRDADTTNTGKNLTPVEQGKAQLDACKNKEEIKAVWGKLDTATKAALKEYAAELGKKLN